MDILTNRRFLAISLGHLTVDVFNSMVPLLLAALSVPLDLSNTEIGLIITIYSFGGSLSQPVFGYLADRFGGRWLAVGGVLWVLLFFSLAPLAPGKLALLCLVLAALGSGAYHPQGASNAARASVTRAATATAFFFLFGQAGLALGPAAGGVLIEVAGLKGLWLPAVLGTLVVILLWRTYDDLPAAQPVALQSARSGQTSTFRVATYLLIIFAVMIFLRSSVQAGTTTFIPKLFAERGVSPASYGVLLSAFMLGSAFGGVFGGSLADRVGRKPVVVISMLLMTIPLLAYLRVMNLAAVWFLLLLGGAFHGASHSIIVVIAQSMLPGRQALASGLILGFMFTSGAVGALSVGLAADRFGLELALTILVGAGLLSGLLALALPGEVKPARRSLTEQEGASGVVSVS